MCEKTAVILAGGKGTRLRPYTLTMPKPMVPIGDKPILEIILCQLAKQGFRNIYLAVNYLAETIETYFGNGEKWDLNISYCLEDKPLGTMGPLRKIDNLPDDFIVMNGDVLSDIDYAAFLEEHILKKRLFTIASYERVQFVDYGVLRTQNGILYEFEEKPNLKYDVSMGVYAVNKCILKYIPEDTYFGFDKLMYRLLENKTEVNTKKHEGYWMDIGRPEDYEQAMIDMESHKLTI